MFNMTDVPDSILAASVTAAADRQAGTLDPRRARRVSGGHSRKKGFR